MLTFLDLVDGAAFFAHGGVRLGRAVVVGAKPQVEGYVGLAVVAFEIAVVELVEVGGGGDFGVVF